MEARDLKWLDETLPALTGSCESAEAAVEKALNASAGPEERTRAFWEALGWEIADALQARWAFGELSLEDATILSHELAAHIVKDFAA